MIKKKDLSKEDKKVWEDYVKNPSDIYDKDINALNFAQRKNVLDTIYMDILYKMQI